MFYKLLYFFFVYFIFATCYGQKNYEYYRWNESNKVYEFDFYGKNPSLVLDSLNRVGYYTLEIDSTYMDKIYLNKGKNYLNVWVKNEEIFKDKNFHPTKNLDSIISKYIQTTNENGFTFSQVKLVPKGYINNEQRIEIEVNLGDKRKIDKVKAEGYSKLSKGFIKHQLGLKQNKIYNENLLSNASHVLQNSNYISQIQPPQTLFKSDSTIVYIYPSKLKSNYFDGIIGFGNDDEGKFRLNGNVLLELNNTFNSFEQIRLNWISTANKNTTLDFKVKIPYLFQTPIGSETQLKIFKQDSLFVDLNLNQRLFFHINQNSNLGGNISYKTSNYLFDDENVNVKYDDYTKIGFGLNYQFYQKHPLTLMEGKSYLNVFANSISRKENNYSLTEDYDNKKTKQLEFGLDTYRIFKLINKHYIKSSINVRGLFDKNKKYSENELYRFGGFGSLRGFNEESIYANLYGIGSIEYRFIPNEGFYVNIFGDYAFSENKRINLNKNFIGIGAGLSFMTKLGIFNLSYAVGKTDNTPFDFDNSKIHFGILSQF